MEHRLLLPGGRVKVVVERGTTRFDGKGQPLRSIGTVQDVSAFNAVKMQLEHAAFVDQLSQRDTDRSIVAATIVMAGQLGLTTLAEGVESEEQFALLRELGCDLFQGYLFSPPLDVPAMQQLLHQPVLKGG